MAKSLKVRSNKGTAPEAAVGKALLADGTTPYTPGVGRPPVPDEKRRDVLLRVAVTEAERDRFQAAAERAGSSLSTWMRQLALRASEPHGHKPIQGE